jgi:hypothetical protein
LALPVIPDVNSAKIGELGSKLDQPLEKELNSMIRDTRGAIQFVAANFMPEGSQ